MILSPVCKVSTEAVGFMAAATLYRWGEREGNGAERRRRTEGRDGRGKQKSRGRGWDEPDGSEGGRLGSVPSGRCASPCDAAILPHRVLLLDNIRGL